MIHKITSTIFILCIACCYTNGQETARQNISIELGGAGLGLGFNYEYTLINKEKISLTPKIGLGYCPMFVNSKMALGTLTPNIGLFTKYAFHSHHIEAGLASTFAFSIDNVTNNKRYNNISWLLFPSIGYRYQKSGRKKMVYRIGYSPAISFEGISPKYRLLHYKTFFYLGAGYSF